MIIDVMTMIRTMRTKGGRREGRSMVVEKEEEEKGQEEVDD